MRGAYFRGLLTGPITGGFLQGRGLLQDLSKILITGAYCRAGSYNEDVSGWEGGCGKASSGEEFSNRSVFIC